MRSHLLGFSLVCLLQPRADRTSERPIERPIDVARRVGAMPTNVVALKSGELHEGALEASLPARANDALRLSARGAWIELAATGVNAAPLAIEDGVAVYRDVAPATDVLYVATEKGLEDLRVLRDERASATMRYRVRASGDLSLDHGKLVATDAEGRAQLTAAAPVAIDDRGVQRAATLSLEGDELVVAVDTHGLAYPIVVDPFWAPTMPLSTKRGDSTSTLLATGKVLVAGGGASGSSSGTSTAEIYDPASNAWTTTGSMKVERRQHRATLLASGKVLVVGGVVDSITLKSAEIYDPTAKTWTSTAPMAVARQDFSLTTLPSGKVLAAGGYDAALTPLSTSEIYDPGTSTWSAGPPLPAPRGGHFAFLVAGKVHLVAGEEGDSDAVMPLALGGLVYDPAAGWSKTADYVVPRSTPAAALVGGKIYLVGGDNFDATMHYSSAEVFDPSANKWTKIASIPKPVSSATAAPLPDGRVLLAGGQDPDALDDLASCLAYDASKDTWSTFPSLNVGRSSATSTVLPDGRVMLVGGFAESAAASAEVLTIVAKTCTADGECLTGHCVDGVCCNSACTGQCEACNLPGNEGSCSPVSGTPVGKRPACAGAGEADLCKHEVCDGTNRTACTTSNGACSVKGCKDGVETHDGTCKMGACSDVPVNCGAYACGASACNTTCTTDADCSKGYRCDATKCVPATATCDDATNSTVSTTPPYTSTPCAPYRCDGSHGSCFTACTATAQCADGAVCDNGKCIAPAASEDSGGCNYGRGLATPFAALIALGLVSASRRRGSSRSRPRG